MGLKYHLLRLQSPVCTPPPLVITSIQNPRWQRVKKECQLVGCLMLIICQLKIWTIGPKFFLSKNKTIGNNPLILQFRIPIDSQTPAVKKLSWLTNITCLTLITLHAWQPNLLIMLESVNLWQILTELFLTFLGSWSIGIHNFCCWHGLNL